MVIGTTMHDDLCLIAIVAGGMSWAIYMELVRWQIISKTRAFKPHIIELSC